MVYYNALLCCKVLDFFGWVWGDNWFASWLANQIPYDSW